VERALICPPRCRMGAITPEERAAVRARSPVGARYDSPVNRESAYEILSRRAATPGASPAERGPAAAQKEAERRGQLGDLLWGTKRRQGMVETMAKQAAGRWAGDMWCRLGSCPRPTEQSWWRSVRPRMTTPASSVPWTACPRASGSGSASRCAPDPARFFADELRFMPPTLKRLGELYEQRGNREKALEYYGRFVDLWKDADAALQPIVQEVRQWMARLAREQP
jgi:hypothetical protein